MNPGLTLLSFRNDPSARRLAGMIRPSVVLFGSSVIPDARGRVEAGAWRGMRGGARRRGEGDYGLMAVRWLSRVNEPVVLDANVCEMSICSENVYSFAWMST